MKPLLSALNDIPEYRSLLAAIDGGACPAAFSGTAVRCHPDRHPSFGQTCAI